MITRYIGKIPIIYKIDPRPKSPVCALFAPFKFFVWNSAHKVGRTMANIWMFSGTIFFLYVVDKYMSLD